MISSLRGRVLHVEPDSVVLDVNGVGYAVAVTAQLARELHLGDERSLHTALIVREDSMSLFGFAERADLDVFGQLLSVSGVGPKSALGVLSSLTVDQIARIARCIVHCRHPGRKFGSRGFQQGAVDLGRNIARQYRSKKFFLFRLIFIGNALAISCGCIIDLGWNQLLQRDFL